MWLFTKFGFFSVVQKPRTSYLTVRARVKTDLDVLREEYLPELSPTQGKAGTDYPWRATVAHDKFAAALNKIAMDINYDNFKSVVMVKQGKERTSRYMRVWQALYDMPDDAHH